MGRTAVIRRHTARRFRQGAVPGRLRNADGVFKSIVRAAVAERELRRQRGVWDSDLDVEIDRSDS